MLKISNLSKKYGNRALFSNINYIFEDKGLYSITGNSGCGKSTILNILSSLDLDFEGDIYFNNLSYKVLNKDQIRELRRTKFGFIFQSFNLFENETVLDNITLVKHSKNKSINSINLQEIEDILKRIGIYEIRNETVSHLSGGEKQRVAIARAIINRPEIIFCDEPTGSLDDKNSDEIFKILQDLSLESLVIVVTHDLNRAKAYSNYIIDLNNQTVKLNKKILSSTTKKIKSPITFKISFKHIVKAIKNQIRSKRMRYIASNSVFSLSLICLGLTIFISTNIERGINKAFSTLISDKSLILKKKNDNSNLSISALDGEKVKEIYSKYTSDIKYYGTKFLFNYKEFFPEKSNIYYENNNILRNMFSLNVNSINEFKYLTEEVALENTFYPKINQNLTDDQIILSLNYKQMEELCLNLRIERTFNSLGKFLEEKPLKLILKTKNSSWNYEDEQVFYLKSVLLKPNLEIYHTNNLFNYRIYHDFMRFPTSNEIYSKHDLPWVLNQIYYLKTKVFPNNLITKLEYDEDFKNVIFEPDNPDFSPGVCKEEELCNTNKVFLLTSKEDIFKSSIINKIQQIDSSFNSYYFSTPGGYMNLGGSLFNGFAKEMYFSLDKAKLLSIENVLQKINIQDFESAKFTDEVARGYSLDTSMDNVKYSIRLDGNYKGSKDFSVQNIAISTGLAKRLSKNSVLNKDIYLMFNYETKSKDNYYFKKFKIAKLKIIGTVENNAFKIYNNKDFSIALFRDIFNVSSIELIPDSVVFEFENKPSKKTINYVNQRLEDYELIDPFDDINQNIDDVLKYFDYALIIFTVFASISSIILMFVVSTINFEDYKKDIAIYQMLGFKDSEINKVQLFNNFSYTLPSLISSIISILVVSFFISKIIYKEIGLEIGFEFPYIALLGITLLSIFMTFISYIFAISYMKKVKITEELHKIT